MDLATLPPRVTTSELASLMRLSVRTILKRVRTGTLGIPVADQGREKLFARQDVVRLLAPVSPELVAQREPDGPRVTPHLIKAAREAQTARRKRSSS